MNEQSENPEHAGNSKKSLPKVMRGCFMAVAAGFLICILAFIAVIGFLFVGIAMEMASPPQRRAPIALRELHLSGPVKGPKLAVINVEGLIFGSSTPTPQISPVAVISAKLERAFADENVKAVILHVDSPGGGVTGADILNEKIAELRREYPDKPVVASILNLAASGAYYGICGVDKIVAHPTSLVGSIGVMMPLYDASELMNKIGVKEESIKSGEFKDIGSPLVERSDEEKEKHRELLREIVYAMHERFVDTVANGRQKDFDEVAEVADGRIFTAPQALELGFVDSIGYERDVVEAAKELTGITQPVIVQYRRDVSFGALLASLISAEGFNFQNMFGDLLFDNNYSVKPYPLYLWSVDEEVVLSNR